MSDGPGRARSLYHRNLLWVWNGEGEFYPARLRLSAIEIYFRQGKWPGAEELCRHGTAACEKLGRKYEQGLFLNQMGNILSYRGLRQEALDAMHRAHEILSQWPEKTIMVSVLYNLGYAYEHTGDLDKALEYYRTGQDLARKLGEEKSESRANGNIGIIHAMRGDYDTALVYFNKLLDSSRRQEDLAGVALAHGNLGLALLYSGKPDQAEIHLQQKLKLSKEMGDRLGICQARGSLGDLLAARGDYDSALQSYGLAKEHAQAMNNLNMTVSAEEKTGEVLMLLGRHQEAADVLNRGIKLIEQVGTKLTLPSLWQKAGACYLELEQLGPAEKAFNRSIEIGKDGGQEPFYMGAYRGLARLELHRGRHQPAMENCRIFLELSRKYNDQDYVFDGLLLECRITADQNPTAAVDSLTELIKQYDSPKQRAEILYRLWEIRGTPQDRQTALKALKLAVSKSPTALNKDRLAKLQA